MTLRTPISQWGVDDARGTGAGWTVFVQATQMTAANGKTLARGSLTMVPPSNVAPAQITNSSTAPVPVSSPIAIDGATAIPVASAAPGAGMGQWNFTQANGGGGDLSLLVPPHTSGGDYASTITYTLTNGPVASMVSSALIAETPGQIQTECANRVLTLTDLVIKGNRVQILGAAARRFIDKRVQIRFNGGSVVAAAVVRSDGTFATTAPLPPSTLRYSNSARYQAQIGSTRSLNLKLIRRLVLNPLSSRGGKVLLSGQVVLPLTQPASAIAVMVSSSCETWQTIAQVKPQSDGRYSITVTPPSTGLPYVYRLITKVRVNTSSTKTFKTYSLPLALQVG